MKKIGFIIVMFVSVMTSVDAQDKFETTISADVVSQYIWRGQNLGSVSVQPTMGLSYKGFGISAFGNIGLSEPADTKEFDLTAAYATDGFNIGVTDYWFSKPNEKYFAYKAHSTSHIFEANVGYDFGLLGIQWYTNFAGNDGMNKSGKRAYSSYFELSAPFKMGGCDWKVTLGAVPYATSSYLSANGFAITNVALKAVKEIKVKDTFSVPLFASLIANPSTQKAYFVVGLTVK